MRLMSSLYSRFPQSTLFTSPLSQNKEELNRLNQDHYVSFTGNAAQALIHKKAILREYLDHLQNAERDQDQGINIKSAKQFAKEYFPKVNDNSISEKSLALVISKALEGERLSSKDDETVKTLINDIQSLANRLRPQS